MTKYSAKPTECQHGHKHASAKEARRCNDLHMLARAGLITDLEIEPKFYFVIDGRQLMHGNGRRASFKPDFLYTENGRRIAEDIKGGKATKTEAFVLRWALAQHLYPDIEWRLA